MDTMVLRNLSYGLFVLGAKDGSRLTGCTVNSVGQVTSDPALISVCVNHDNFTNRCVKESKGFSASILSEECTGEIIGNFGFRSGRDADKFAAVPYGLSSGGYPVLEFGACGWLECCLEDMLELPTHTLFIGRLVDAKTGTGSPMTYAYYHKVIRGKTPPKAPSYEPPKTGFWTCPVCGWQYDAAGSPFEELPEDWKCPVCGMPKNAFTKS